MTRRATAHAHRAAPPRKILIVEDRESLRCAVEELIETDTELTVCAAEESAEDALAALEGGDALEPDLAVVDISLPGMNGLELTTRLSELRPRMPVLILSSHPPEIYERPALAAGARAYLAKSRTASDLLAAIHRLLENPHGGGGSRAPRRANGAKSANPAAGDHPDPHLSDPRHDYKATILRRRPFTLRQ